MSLQNLFNYIFFSSYIFINTVITTVILFIYYCFIFMGPRPGVLTFPSFIGNSSFMLCISSKNNLLNLLNLLITVVFTQS